MNFHIITIFPEIFNSYINESILKRAQKNNIIKIVAHNLRDWTTDKHKTVDDTPYGGGAGMVMKIEPLYKAIKDIKAPLNKGGVGDLKPGKTKVVLLSAKGKKWTQQMARQYAKPDNVIMICGRYEGVDERIRKFIDEEISIGDYVLTGGELGAMVMVDSITRLLPGALGNVESSEDESHTKPGILEYPQYTRPEAFEYAPLIKGDKGGLKKLKVPKVLLSGNHAEIEKWRERKKKKRE